MQSRGRDGYGERSVTPGPVLCPEWYIEEVGIGGATRECGGGAVQWGRRGPGYGGLCSWGEEFWTQSVPVEVLVDRGDAVTGEQTSSRILDVLKSIYNFGRCVIKDAVAEANAWIRVSAVEKKSDGRRGAIGWSKVKKLFENVTFIVSKLSLVTSSGHQNACVPQVDHWWLQYGKCDYFNFSFKVLTLISNSRNSSYSCIIY